MYMNPLHIGVVLQAFLWIFSNPLGIPSVSNSLDPNRDQHSGTNLFAKVISIVTKSIEYNALL